MTSQLITGNEIPIPLCAKGLFFFVIITLDIALQFEYATIHSLYGGNRIALQEHSFPAIVHVQAVYFVLFIIRGL